MSNDNPKVYTYKKKILEEKLDFVSNNLIEIDLNYDAGTIIKKYNKIYQDKMIDNNESKVFEFMNNYCYSGTMDTYFEDDVLIEKDNEMEIDLIQQVDNKPVYTKRSEFMNTDSIYESKIDIAETEYNSNNKEKMEISNIDDKFKFKKIAKNIKKRQIE